MKQHQYVIYRHGSNGANQERRQIKPVALETAPNFKAAIQQAGERPECHCYNNQWLSVKGKQYCPKSDIQEAAEHRRGYEEWLKTSLPVA